VQLFRNNRAQFVYNAPDNDSVIVTLEESGISEAFQDYFESLRSPEFVFSKERLNAIMESVLSVD